MDARPGMELLLTALLHMRGEMIRYRDSDRSLPSGRLRSVVLTAWVRLAERRRFHAYPNLYLADTQAFPSITNPSAVPRPRPLVNHRSGLTLSNCVPHTSYLDLMFLLRARSWILLRGTVYSGRWLGRLRGTGRGWAHPAG